MPLQQNYGPLLTNTQQSPYYHPVVVQPIQYEGRLHFKPVCFILFGFNYL